MTGTKKSVISVLCTASLLGTCMQMPFSHAAESSGPVINEVCAGNTSFAAADGKFYDWIEIYNSSDVSTDLSGYGISDNASKPYRFTFPDGTVIGPGEYITVFCSSKEITLNGQYTASFGLSADGETVTLTDRNGNVSDTVSFGSLDSDVSYGRITDGGSSFAVMSMTPGASNSSDSVIKKVVQSPSFSVPSGFYSDSFDLEITAEEGSKIYFTVDSSTPDKSSNEYTSAFSISNAVSQNRESQRKPEDGREPGGPDGGKPEGGGHEQRPEEGQPGGAGTSSSDAAVIRAVACDPEGNMSEPVTAVYFIGYQNKASYYQSMKVISIVTDRDNLFSKQTGIWQNYENEGREWERPANIQIFSGGRSELNQDAGIRIHGGYTRRFSQKSFNVYARDEYGCSSFEYDLFSGTLRSEATGKKIKKFDSFILRNGGNDCQDTRFRDKLNQALVNDRNFLEQAMEPCIVFVNGEFYGHYEITEKISKDYIKSHTGVNKKDVCIIKNQKLDEGDEETYSEYNELAEWVKKTDFSSSENYAKLCSLVDIDSFIDYMGAEIYLGNKDWGKNNCALWKAVNTDDSNPYADGRWRFILFDTEFNSGIYNTVPANINIFSTVMKDGSFVGTLLSNALKNDEFRMKFSVAFMDMAGSNFSSDRVNSLISEYTRIYQQPAQDTQKKFWGNSSFSSAVSTVKNWYGSRYSSAVSQLKSAAGLKGSLVSFSLINDSSCGKVKLNTLTPDGNYTGKYYTDFPVTVTAEPAEGYSFEGWKLSDGTVIKSRTAEIKLDGDISVTAVYSTSGSSAVETVSGDVNMDGIVNVQDLLTIIGYMTDGSSDYAAAADINGDGKVNIIDIITLKNRLC